MNSNVLISVQAVLSRDLTNLTSVALSPWIRDYVASLPEGELPPVTRIVFGPPSDKVQLTPHGEYVPRSPAPTDTLEIWNTGSDWSVTAYKWVKDESMPGHLARQLTDQQSPK